jgi:hypothetical protein
MRPSDGRWKLSLRPFVQGASVPYTNIPRVIDLLGQSDFWDISVYKPGEQLLSAINGCKGLSNKDGQKDRRILRPVNPEHGQGPALLMYVAQHLLPGWTQLPDPPPLEDDVVEGDQVGEEALPDAPRDDDAAAALYDALTACLSQSTSPVSTSPAPTSPAPASAVTFLLSWRDASESSESSSCSEVGSC